MDELGKRVNVCTHFQIPINHDVDDDPISTNGCEAFRKITFPSDLNTWKEKLLEGAEGEPGHMLMTVTCLEPFTHAYISFLPATDYERTKDEPDDTWIKDAPRSIAGVFSKECKSDAFGFTATIETLRSIKRAVTIVIEELEQMH